MNTLSLDENVTRSPSSPRRAIHGHTTPITAIATSAMIRVRGIVDLSRTIIEDGD